MKEFYSPHILVNERRLHRVKKIRKSFCKDR